jgi:hypothetical protein
MPTAAPEAGSLEFAVLAEDIEQRGGRFSIN